MKHSLLLITTMALLFTACKKETPRIIDKSYKPDVSLAKFTNSTTITNPYFPVAEGKKYIYEGQMLEGLERIDEQRLASTKTILGITCIVVEFRAFLNGTLIEKAIDWYAQDNAG